MNFSPTTSTAHSGPIKRPMNSQPRPKTQNASLRENNSWCPSRRTPSLTRTLLEMHPGVVVSGTLHVLTLQPGILSVIAIFRQLSSELESLSRMMASRFLPSVLSTTRKLHTCRRSPQACRCCARYEAGFWCLAGEGFHSSDKRPCTQNEEYYCGG